MIKNNLDISAKELKLFLTFEEIIQKFFELNEIFYRLNNNN